VLSPYNAQVDAMARDLASSDDLQEVEALTIDRAQGRDVECVVISFVRANERRETGGLLSNRRRLNVALTRARSKLIIVGNAETLKGSHEMQQVMGICTANAWVTRLQGT
jgi:DNA replication ATP-dependent helicase Dna2